MVNNTTSFYSQGNFEPLPSRPPTGLRPPGPEKDPGLGETKKKRNLHTGGDQYGPMENPLGPGTTCAIDVVGN